MPGTIPRPAGPVRDLADWNDWRYQWGALMVGIGISIYVLAFLLVPVAELSDAPGGNRLGVLLVSLVEPIGIMTNWLGGKWENAGLLDRLPILFFALILLLTAYGLGDALMGRLDRHGRLTSLQRGAWGVAAGLHLLSLWTLAVGLAGGLRQPAWFYPPILLAMGLLIRKYVARHRESTVPEESGEPAPARTRNPASSPSAPAEKTLGNIVSPRFLWLALPFVCVMAASALLPPFDFDVLEYHLQVPKQWYQQGRITFLPENIYGNMPLGAEMLATTAMAIIPGQDAWWWGAMTGKFLMFCFTPLTALALAAAGKRLGRPGIGYIAALLYLITPWTTEVSVNGLNEGVLGAYFFAAFSLTVMGCGKEGSFDLGLLALAGFFAGAAASCKYTAIVFLMPPLVAWIVWRTRSACLRPLGLFLLAAALSGGLWYAKNAVLTGNPVYPLGYRVFDGTTRTPEKDAQWRHAHRVPPDAEGRRYGPLPLGRSILQTGLTSPWLGPLLWPLALVGLWVGRRRDEIRLAGLLIAYVLAVWWLTTHRIDRFWTPLLPLIALAGGAVVLGIRPDSLARRLLIALIGLGWLIGLLMILSPRWMKIDPRLFARLEPIRNGQMIGGGGGFSVVNSVHVYLNENLQPGEKVLLVGDAQPFDLKGPALYNTCFDDCRFEQLLAGRSAQQQLQALHDAGIAYVYVHWDELGRYRSPGNYGYSSDYVAPQVVEELVERGVLLSPIDIGQEHLGQLFPVHP